LNTKDVFSYYSQWVLSTVTKQHSSKYLLLCSKEETRTDLKQHEGE